MKIYIVKIYDETGYSIPHHKDLEWTNAYIKREDAEESAAKLLKCLLRNETCKGWTTEVHEAILL